MKAVKFLQPTKLGTLYNVDEVAGFDDAVADGLVKEKRAVLVAKPASDKKEEGGK